MLFQRVYNKFLLRQRRHRSLLRTHTQTQWLDSEVTLTALESTLGLYRQLAAAKQNKFADCVLLLGLSGY